MNYFSLVPCLERTVLLPRVCRQDQARLERMLNIALIVLRRHITHAVYVFTATGIG